MFQGNQWSFGEMATRKVIFGTGAREAGNLNTAAMPVA